MDVHLSRGVGPGRPNRPLDVGAVEDLLNRATGELPVKWHGVIGPTDLDHIRRFQQDVMYVRVPDSRVDPGGVTLRTLNRLARNVPLLPAHKQGSAVYAGWSGLDIDAFVNLYKRQFGDAPAGLATLATAIKRDREITDIRWMAYMLATAWVETGRFVPIPENTALWTSHRVIFPRSVKHSAANLTRPRADHGYGDTVVFVDAAGHEHPHVYHGRGYVQLTWWDNYLHAGERLGLGEALAIDPDSVLEEGIAYRIMSDGMRNGGFTGRALARFIHDDVCDYLHARQIINGMDKAQQIADRATGIEMLLRLATG